MAGFDRAVGKERVETGAFQHGGRGVCGVGFCHKLTFGVENQIGSDI